MKRKQNIRRQERDLHTSQSILSSSRSRKSVSFASISVIDKQEEVSDSKELKKYGRTQIKRDIFENKTNISFF